MDTYHRPKRDRSVPFFLDARPAFATGPSGARGRYAAARAYNYTGWRFLPQTCGASDLGAAKRCEVGQRLLSRSYPTRFG